LRWFIAKLDLLSETSIIVTLVITLDRASSPELGREANPAEVVVVEERNCGVRRGRVGAAIPMT
jgi:hypothetical protein